MTKREAQNSILDQCVFCGAYKVVTIYRDKLFGAGANAVIIENLPILRCEACGESRYDPEVSELIDEIIAHPEKHAVKRAVNIASLLARRRESGADR
jgi:YgiT-type zinc finger domain-containing protein